MDRRRLILMSAAALTVVVAPAVIPLEADAQLDAEARRRRRGRKRRGGKRGGGGGGIRDRDCGDFPTQSAAQNFFRKEQQRLGVYDAHGLDGDSDGIACESNP